MLLLLFLFTFVNPFPQINLVLHLCKTTQNHKHDVQYCSALSRKNEIFLICVIFITVKAVNYY